MSVTKDSKTDVAEHSAGPWRCFHCSFETSDPKEAEAHFGDESSDPALCLMWSAMDDSERAHAYQQLVLELNGEREETMELRTALENESAERMRLFRELQSRMDSDLRWAEGDAAVS